MEKLKIYQDAKIAAEKMKNFSSIVEKNDSEKSIILNAIASFLDPKTCKLVDSDFSDLNDELGSVVEPELSNFIEEILNDAN